MLDPSPKEVTQLLVEWRNGDQAALDKLMPLVYSRSPPLSLPPRALGGSTTNLSPAAPMIGWR